MSEMPALRGVSAVQLPLLLPRPIDVHAVSMPARTFTGDFYFTHRRGQRLWFAHGDVAGKGLPAAIVMAMLQEEIEHRITSCASMECDPAATTLRLHEFLLPLLPGNRFVTAVIGHLADDGTLTLANAGHCPPIVRRADGSIETIGSTGPVLGVLPLPSWSTHRTRMERGDSLILYSDGVAEAEVDGQELGVEGVVRRVLEGGRSADIARMILDGIETSDDATVVVFRV